MLIQIFRRKTFAELHATTLIGNFIRLMASMWGRNDVSGEVEGRCQSECTLVIKFN